jgi:RNA polymerase sigma-70 factor, ECF subfamily
MSENEVIERVRRGETGLYADLILRYRQRLQSTLYPILRNEAEVEDAMQEGHAHALAHLGQFAGRSSFLTWMTRIMIHEAFGILRRRRRLRQLDAPASAEAGPRIVLTSRGRNPEQQALDRELRAALARALRLLPEPYRTVFTLREIEDVSTARVAGMLGISEECVRIRLHRARALLRRKLGKRPAARCQRRNAR